jgi:hypothetical protein
MRALLSSALIATVCLAGSGCASRPVDEKPVASLDTVSFDQQCANAAGNSLHLTSTSSSNVIEHDTAIDSILSQPVSDERLARINRRMYQSLRSLDAELRREEMLAACEKQPTLEAQASSGAVPAAGSAAPPSVAVASSAVAAAGTTRAFRRTSLSPGSTGGGNGATAPRIVPGSDNDVVARRLRKAAEQETNPSLRAKLWKEYTDYRQGSSVK